MILFYQLLHNTYYSLCVFSESDSMIHAVLICCVLRYLKSNPSLLIQISLSQYFWRLSVDQVLHTTSPIRTVGGTEDFFSCQHSTSRIV